MLCVARDMQRASRPRPNVAPTGSCPAHCSRLKRMRKGNGPAELGQTLRVRSRAAAVLVLRPAVRAAAPPVARFLGF